MWTRKDPVYLLTGGLITCTRDKGRLEQLLKYYS
jgi:hypothetical protein